MSREKAVSSVILPDKRVSSEKGKSDEDRVSSRILLINPKNASTRLSVNGKIPNDFERLPVRPEALEG